MKTKGIFSHQFYIKKKKKKKNTHYDSIILP